MTQNQHHIFCPTRLDETECETLNEEQMPIVEQKSDILARYLDIF